MNLGGGEKMSKKIKEIMEKDNKERILKLKEYARKLGCSLVGDYNARSDKFREDVIVARIINTERSNREEKLWIIALLSAIASVISALAAWIAVANLLN